MERPGIRRAAAWGVHLYTALGLPLAFLAAGALAERDAQRFFAFLLAAAVVDGTDGALARAVRVRETLPELDGRRLDDLIDFLTYAFLPALALVAFGLLPAGAELAAVVPLVASGYGFCQERAKTGDSFVGFPSYWNVVVLYLYALGADPRLNLAIVLFLSLMVFVPIHYVYPTKTRFLRRTTLGLMLAWAAALAVILADLEASRSSRLALLSLAVPAYYAAVSWVHHSRVTARSPKSSPPAARRGGGAPPSTPGD
jgi:phosphatidylcholine synthase